STFFISMIPHPPRSPLFPYTTLFRSSTDAGSQIRKPPAGERELPTLAGQRKPLAVRRHVDGEEIHRGGADEARHKPVGRLAVERSEEHTSELQSRFDLVCRLLLEKKK